MGSSTAAKANVRINKLKLAKAPPKLNRDKVKKLAKKLDGNIGQDKYVEQQKLRVYSTGCLGLDCAIGKIDPIERNGGVPERSVIEIFGENGVYKSGTLEWIILSVQRRGRLAVVLYTEEPDYERMKRIGIDLDMLIVINCYTLSNREKRYLLAEKRLKDLLVASADPDVGLIAMDSLKSLTSALQFFEKGDAKKGIERKFEDSEVAVRARLMEKFFDRLRLFKNDYVITVIVNQMSEHIPNPKDAMKRQPGEESRPKTSGGRRKEFECILRIQVTSKSLKSKLPHEGLGSTDQPLEGYYAEYGKRIFYKLWKNKYSQFTGMRRVATNFVYELQAFDWADEVVQYGVYLGLIERKGNYYYYGKHKWNSKDKCIDAFRKSPKATDRLGKKIVSMSRTIFALKPGGEKRKAKYVLDSEYNDKALREAAEEDKAA